MKDIYLKFQMICILCLTIIIVLTVSFIIPGNVLAENNKPVAVIDGTLNVMQGKTVYLDGTFSSDPDGDNLSYSWTLLSVPEGSLATISSPSNPQASFEGDAAGQYKVRLVVNDGLLDSDPSYADVRVTEGE